MIEVFARVLQYTQLGDCYIRKMFNFKILVILNFDFYESFVI